MEPVDLALLMIRLVVGAAMIAHGVNHWIGGGKIAGTASWFEGLGLRHGQLQAWASVVTEIGAGVLLVLGLLTSLASAAVISIALVAGLLAHRRNGFFVFKDGYEYVLVLAVVAASLAMLGPGQASLDHAIGINLDGWTGLLLSVGVAVVATGGLLATTWRPARTSSTS